MPNLYGNRFIEKLVSSGYKNPTYAIAEIIDNSVDANSKNIQIILVEELTSNGSKQTRFISDVLFIDDGTGMNIDQINGCLKFSEGAGTADNRIGTFGVGLPNSSIFVGRRVEVYSKDKKTNKWNYVFLDLDDQATRQEASYDEAKAIEEPIFDNIHLNINWAEKSTIVRWSKITNIGAQKPETVINRTEKLIGRIYRYVLDDINITFASIIKGNREYDIAPRKALAFDPLFLIEQRSQFTDIVWKLAKATDTTTPKIRYNQNVPNHDEFNTKFHYSKYIENCEEYQTIRPLFQKCDNYWELKRTLEIAGKSYTYTMKASFATKSVAHPGIREGGSTLLGQEIKNKMVGTPHFTGGNICFIRTNREVDSGSFGMYSLTSEKERFWTIEIQFDSSLDNLMGLDYQKQKVAFRLVDEEEVNSLENSVELGVNEQQLLLFRKISVDIKDCRKEIIKQLTIYANEFKNSERAAIKETEDDENEDIPEAEPAVFRALPKTGSEWSEDDIVEWTRFLKSRYMSIPEESITRQVTKFARGLHTTVVLYNSDQTGNLFEISTIRGKKVTFINTEHVFYKNIIEPLKDNKTLNIFTTAIEMLLCSYAYEMDSIINDDESTAPLLTEFLRKTSDRLQRFISNGNIYVDTQYWQSKLAQLENIDDDEINNDL
jgi:hypothetical protein